MNERLFNPFDEDWYNKAFQSQTSVAEQLFNRSEIIKQGYKLPDKDGSRSSVFRQDAVANNSFNEKALRDSLKEIYLNNSHKLIASNHSNVHFYHWNGHMSDVTFIPNATKCEIVLPTESFISQKGRDLYKLSPYFNKWIKYTDLLNNWETFKWVCLLFINKKVYSDFELRLDDQQTVIRFPYERFWVTDDYPIYIYKFDTYANTRVRVGRYQMNEAWNWMVPLTEVDPKISGHNHVMVMFNRISAADREDGVTNPNVMGSNIEFASIHDGCIDLTHASEFNKSLVTNELNDKVWMTLIIPRYLHEYPVLLPADVVYRSYRPDYVPVYAQDKNADMRHVKEAENENNLYINMDPTNTEWNDGWQNVIRPIVLADAFDHPEDEPYEEIFAELSGLVDLTVKAADIVEDFLYFTKDYTTDEEFFKHCDALEDIMQQIHSKHNGFLESKEIELNQAYETRYREFVELMPTIRKEKNESTWFQQEFAKHNDFWEFVSPLIWIPRELADRYYIAWKLHVIGDPTIWDTDWVNKQRFRRPVSPADFWIFEWNEDTSSWFPLEMNVEHHFPDVYLLEDPNSDQVEGRIFKAFFFYSDTMNVREPAGDIIRPTPNWDKDMESYEYDKNAAYHDIFMEKFYWMGVKTVYQGTIQTQHRWELIEYIKDNSSFKRFNDLFLQTMDPYYKLGMSEYMKSDNYQFPFDDAIDKLNEAMTLKFKEYAKVTNFEIYLKNTFVPQYFDYITRILDDWSYEGKLLRRPRDSFDPDRILSVITEIRENVHNLTDDVVAAIDRMLSEIKQYGYNFQDSFLEDLKSCILELRDTIDSIYDFLKNLDMDIYSIQDVNDLRDLITKYESLVESVGKALHQLHANNPDIENVNKKIGILKEVDSLINENLFNALATIRNQIFDFDMDVYMKNVCDPAFFEKRNHEGDNSLIGYMNQFIHNWPQDIQKARDDVYVAVRLLWDTFDVAKSYKLTEVDNLFNIAEDLATKLDKLNESLHRFWDYSETYEPDDHLLSCMDYAITELAKFKDFLEVYLGQEKILFDVIDEIRVKMLETEEYGISKREERFMSDIDDLLDDIIAYTSYMSNDKIKEAYKARMSANTQIKNWISYVEHELEVYKQLIELAKEPNPFMENIKVYSDLVAAINEYLSTLDHEFVPSTEVETYADVYEVDGYELLTGGFLNKQDDEIYAPDLGSFRATAVEDTVGACTETEKLNYRCTTFKNPMWQSNPFDSITNGSGIGITFKPTSVKTTHIINDTLVDIIIARIKDIFSMISKETDIINPYSNAKLADAIETIREIEEGWDRALEAYSEHMSETGITTCNEMLDSIYDLTLSLDAFMNVRSQCDLGGFISLFNSFIRSEYDAFNDAHMITTTYVYYDGRLRARYNEALEFYGTGSEWNDPDEVKKVINNCVEEINIFSTQLMILLPDTDYRLSLMYVYNETLTKAESVIQALDDIGDAQATIKEAVGSLTDYITNLPPDLVVEHWYEFNSVSIGTPGTGYKVGDVVQIVPLEENIDMTDDKLLLRITQVNNKGAVMDAVPLLDYAVPYSVWGSMGTETLVGEGKGLTINAAAKEVDIFNTDIFKDPTSDKKHVDQFDRNDMFMFKFENIHDLPVQYEVFLAGKQQLNAIVRHVPTPNPLHPENIDVVYINANEVMNLLNSAIEVEEEHYLTYSLDSIDISDPGMGYAVGQEITVDANKVPIKLRVTKLKPTPFKEIESVELVEGQNHFEGFDPTSTDATVVDDVLNNIDDEYYGDERNTNFMYPDVDFSRGPQPARNGDPDGHWHLGSREDYSAEKLYNSVMNMIPPTDDFIPEEQRLPSGQPTRGEFQLIDRVHIHNLDASILTGISESEIGDIVDGGEVEPQGTFTVHEFNIDSIPVENVEQVIAKEKEPEATPMIEVDGHVIKAVDASEVKGLIYGDIIPPAPPAPFIDEHEISASSLKDAANEVTLSGDKVVETHAQLPQHIKEWPECMIGKTVIVETDETMANHRTMYRVRTYVISGYIVYDTPELADWSWNTIDVNWLTDDSYPDLPTLEAQYPDGNWYESKTYREVEESIVDGNVTRKAMPKLHQGTYIDQLTPADISVYNYTLHQWEDLTDAERWTLTEHKEEGNYGFTLTFNRTGNYSYDMLVYLNKVPDNLHRNAALKKPAKFNIKASIESEVNVQAGRYSVNTGRHLRIRKLFPYEQKETFTVGLSTSKNIDFKLANYMHYKNEIHAEDIIVYNKTLDRYENIFDQKLFELQFKDDKAFPEGYETQTVITQVAITSSGEGFVNGYVWAYNNQRDVHIFGRVETDEFGDGSVLTFEPIHFVNPPLDDITLEFHLYQDSTARTSQAAVALVEFQTAKVQVSGNGYLRHVTNPLAPVPKQFRIVCQYDMDQDYEYEISISKSPKVWKFIEEDWRIFPTFYIHDQVPADRLYILTENGRIPLVNPATNKPSFLVTYHEEGMDVMFMNIYKRYEQLEIHSTPYPMRSVYTMRRIPESGFIDLKGRINKPLDKKYFEFWVNGRLLDDEVTIISPTKIFLHGLTSLRNLEIIEINRDINEYFADPFIGVDTSDDDRPYPQWNYRTYLDDALEGTLEGDNYRLNEQESLLTPVWKQVSRDNPEFKNFPPNRDMEDDILIKVDDYADIQDSELSAYQFMIEDLPSIEGVVLSGQNTSFEMFGFIPITDKEITDMLDEEWAEEIEEGLIPRHTIISEDDYYGKAVRLIDEFGQLVNTLDEAAYWVSSSNMLRIHHPTKEARIVRSEETYDLT